MSVVLRVALDLMGADHSPKVLAEGAFAAAREHPDLSIALIATFESSKEIVVPENLSEQVKLVFASQVIGMDEQPLMAVRRKPDASLVVGMKLLGSGEVDAFVTPGNTGAAVAAASLHVGCLPPITRPAIAIILPHHQGRFLLLDVGANVDCKPEHFLQFALMGTAYAETVMGIENPRVALLNIGEEAIKGTNTAKEAFLLLQSAPLNFVGNVEGRDLLEGAADVVVTDGFVGNILLKAAEGIGLFIWREIKDLMLTNWRTKLAGLLLRPYLKALGKRLDWREYGGAPLLGIKATCIIAHGASDSKAIAKAISVARENVIANAVEKVAQKLQTVVTEVAK
ncbi:MAG: phosphate acyltransferase PlsX [Armatimonadetes bacterium]|nr:phosphate acyltransferase PlsX [Armatimonadota bacterium]MDW8027346.1 phosphate acyltransferase PlsX [Armatimonadota bacterium]